MGISFGSNSMKPYVGGKEVQEAYVGSQKVYSAAPPIYYGFLGTENDYVLASWCGLTKGAAIAKNQNIYRIAINGVTAYDTNFITLSEIKGTILKFIFYCSSTVGYSQYSSINWRNSSGAIIKQTKFNPSKGGNDYALIEEPVPEGATSCTINGVAAAGSITLYVDAIRFETEE